MSAGHWVEYVTRVLDESAAHFGHGTDHASDEAAWLVLHVLGQPLDSAAADWEREVNEAEARTIRGLLARRVGERLPLAYLLGSAWFAGLEFEVNPDVLVPRSPLAELVRERFAPWLEPARVRRVLDLCTGCGCIGIATAVYLPWAQVDATDISLGALAVARRNVMRHGVADRVRLIQSDLFESLRGRVYDLVVTNPPYVPRHALPGLPDEYRAEPQQGLASGADGLDACLRIMLQSPDCLDERGVLICEVGESGERLANGLPRVPFLWLEFEHGGSGVFLLTREQLTEARQQVAAWMEARTDVA